MGECFFGGAADGGALWFPEHATDTQRLFYESVKQFCLETMGPTEDALARKDDGLARSLFQKCAELGVFCAELDEADGGLGFGVLDATLLGEAMGWGNSLSVGFMVHQGVGMLPVACFGDADQRARYLPRAASGKCIMAFALTEAHCGSDALALKTRAVPTASGFRINGAKQFITNGAYADCFITFARVPEVGVTAFLVDGRVMGVSVGPEERKLGQHASSTCSVSYEDVDVEHDGVLGEPGQGHKIALNMLNVGRLKLAAACVGKMKSLLPQAITYTSERRAFGHSISEFGMLRDRLARMASLVYAAESTVYRVASAMESALTAARGDGAVLEARDRLMVLQGFALECALVKAFATESLGTFTDNMLQLYGGYGFSEEYPAAKAFRDARVTRLYEGTTEICRLTAMQRLVAQLDACNPETGTPKEVFHGLLNAYVQSAGGDLKRLFVEQRHVGDFGASFERIYAAESVTRRSSGGEGIFRDLADYFVAESTSLNLAAAHRIIGGLPSREELDGVLQHSCFRPDDTVQLRDRIVVALVEQQGVPGW